MQCGLAASAPSAAIVRPAWGRSAGVPINTRRSREGIASDVANVYLVTSEGWKVVRVKCGKCGRPTEVSLRTVVYLGKVEIENVPVRTCSSCSVSEVLQEVKSDLTGLLHAMEEVPERARIRFEEHNELAYLLSVAADRDLLAIPLERLVEERVNELLDMMILAQSLQDRSWVADVERRLRQISTYHIAI